MAEIQVLRTREQEYAGDVFKRVGEFGEHHDKGSLERKKYGSMAHKLPVLVHTAGLAQAIAFVSSRGDKAHEALLTDLAATVGYKDDVKRFMNDSRNLAFYEYMRLSQKVMAALLWYKRFAESVLEVQPGDEADEGGRS
jgi:CRISPR-associated protein Cmr5